MSAKRKIDEALTAKDFAEDDVSDSKTKMESDQQLSAESAADCGITPQQLKFYYQNLFPYKDMFTWLSYGNDPASSSDFTDGDFFKKREFSLTIEDGKDEIYMRYRSYTDDEEWKKELTEKVPVKIDIGAVYNASPSMRQSLKNFHPTEKELVFDIDMTDYDDIRKCCDGAKICSKCWTLMTAAVSVIHQVLTDDFGFESVMFVYSGRRGIHCWVNDERARRLPNDARSAIVEYMTFYQGGANQARKVAISTPIHPSVHRAFAILDPYFRQYCDDQDLFSFPEIEASILEMLPGDVREAVRQDWDLTTYGGAYKYKQLRQRLRPKDKAPNPQHLVALMEVVFSFIYPRLDVNVSKQMHHLLKSPFCVHPKTGRVCVPIDPEQVQNFSPFQVPTLNALIQEWDSVAKVKKEEEAAGSRTKKHIETSLSPYTQYFHEKIVNPIFYAIKKSVAQQSLMKAEF